MSSKASQTRRDDSAMPELDVGGSVDRLAVILGDQLNARAEVLTGLDKSRRVPLQETRFLCKTMRRRRQHDHRRD